jgi:copper homeostasis protein
VAADRHPQTPEGGSGPAELEIIACSLEDARAAFEGGASRLEVCVRLAQSGLTPPLSLVRNIIEQVPIPARIMLRERDDFVLAGPEELAALQAHAREFAGLGVDGLVIGHIRDGDLDANALRAVIGAVPAMRFTLHHAVEKTADPIETLRLLRDFDAVDRALVRGGKGTLQERIKRLLAYKEAFGTERHLTVGGDLTVEMLRPLREATGIQVFHLGRAARTPEEVSGTVDPRKVRQAMEALLG